MIRLIATDLDGTLLEPDGKLPEGIFETVKQLTEMGICFAACSGRQYGNLERLFAPVADQMAFVCENGALSVVDGAIAGLISITLMSLKYEDSLNCPEVSSDMGI